MIKKSKKGFTIIELIVVIAIIAVLAGIVLINVTGYINKGRDAAAQGNLASMLTNGAVFYDANSSFTNFITVASPVAAGAAATCTGNAGFVGPCQAITGTSATTGYQLSFTCAGTSCTVGATGWCAIITLKSGNTYCVDSNGNKLNKSGGTCAAGVCS